MFDSSTALTFQLSLQEAYGTVYSCRILSLQETEDSSTVHGSNTVAVSVKYQVTHPPPGALPLPLYIYTGSTESWVTKLFRAPVRSTSKHLRVSKKLQDVRPVFDSATALTFQLSLRQVYGTGFETPSRVSKKLKMGGRIRFHHCSCLCKISAASSAKYTRCSVVIP